jgi:hypothetical protein
MVAILLLLCAATAHASPAYWVWGGIPYSSVPAEGAVFFHQGSLDRATLNLQGLSPFPIGPRETHLVFRFEALGEAERQAKLVRNRIAEWEWRQVVTA